MKKVLLTAASGITTLATLALIGGSAFAWTYGLTGNGQCQTDGSFKITWTVDNTAETEPLTITSSSDTAVVPVGTTIPGKTTDNFTQNADGTKANVYTLTLAGNFPSDSTMRSRTATVDLSAACTQPVVVPPVQPQPQPGTVLGATTPTPTTPAPTPQVVAPVGSVNAGSGNPKSLDLVAGLGLVGSTGLAIYGVRRLSKS